jgi:hypothetical protein
MYLWTPTHRGERPVSERRAEAKNESVMVKPTILIGVLLTFLGLGVYAGFALAENRSPSATALIPAFAGIPILLLGFLALRPNLRKHAMHAVSALALLGFLLPVLRLAMQLAQGAEIKPIVLASLLLMALLCGSLLLLCVISFLDARRS